MKRFTVDMTVDKLAVVQQRRHLVLDTKNKATLAKNFVSGLASLLIGLTPQYSFAIDASPPPPVSEAPQPGAPTPQAAKFSEAELELLGKRGSPSPISISTMPSRRTREHTASVRPRKAN